MRNYYKTKGTNVFDYLPLTFHVQDMGDEAWTSFTEEYNRN